MDLIIHDEYVESKKKFISDQIKSLGTQINRFEKIIKEIRNSGVEMGKTAEALEAFAGYLDSLYAEGNFSEFAGQVSMICGSYLTEIDNIDGDLYG